MGSGFVPGGGSGGSGPITSITAPFSAPGGVLTLDVDPTLGVAGGNLGVVPAPGGGLESTPTGLDTNGPTTTVDVVCDVTCDAGTVTVFKRTLSFTKGVLQNIGMCN